MWQQLADKVKTGGQSVVDVLSSMEGASDLMTEEVAAAAGMQEKYNELLETEKRLNQENLTEVERKAVFDQASVQRQNYWIGLLQNFAKAQEVVNDMHNAEGHSLRENEKAMQTLEKRVEVLITSLHELAVQAGDAGLLDLAKWAVDTAAAIAGLTKNVGGLVPVMITLTGLWATLNQQKALKVFDATGLTGAAKGVKSVIDNLRILYYEYESAGKGAQGFGAAAKLAGNEATAAFSGLGIAGWAGIAVMAIGAVVAAVSAYNQSIQKSIEESHRLTEEFVSNQKAGQSNLTTLESLKTEFDELSKGVDSLGNNVSLSADQYKRYKEIVDQILEIQPSLISYYDAEGNAIAENNGLLEKAIELQKALNQEKIDEYLAGGADKLKGVQRAAREARSEILKVTEPLGMWTPNLDELMNVGNTDIINSFGKLKDILDELNISYQEAKGNAGITTGLRITGYERGTAGRNVKPTIQYNIIVKCKNSRRGYWWFRSFRGNCKSASGRNRCT